MLFMLLLALGAIDDARYLSVRWWNPACLLALALSGSGASGAGELGELLGGAGVLGAWTALARRGQSGPADPPVVAACTLAGGSSFLTALGLVLLATRLAPRSAPVSSAGHLPLYPAALAAMTLVRGGVFA